MDNYKDILAGWGEIEGYMRQTRATLISKGYPIYKDSKGSVWAKIKELDGFRAQISANIRKNA